MSRFDDRDEIRRRAKEHLDARQGFGGSSDRQDTRRGAGVRQALYTRKDQSSDPSRASLRAGGGIFAVLKSLPKGSLSLRRIACGLIALALAAILFFSCFAYMRGCSERAVSDDSLPPSDTQPDSSYATSFAESITLPEYLDDELKDALLAQAQTSDALAHIAQRADDYAIDGIEVQQKILKLALKEPAALPFVTGFPDSYPATAGQPYTDALTKGTIPLLQQWDPRWGYVQYSSAPFGLTGCCPTAFSMVYMGLTGKADMTPAAMGELASNNGYMDEFKGTDGRFLLDESASLGLSCNTVPLDAGSLRLCLQAGEIVICNVGPGDFTDDGHFFVIVGLNEDGSAKINDPYSKVRSEKSWDIDVLTRQTIALYSFRLA
ncbi:MAG: papain-like cysteine protease family protein [Raoultibacter sp.]